MRLLLPVVVFFFFTSCCTLERCRKKYGETPSDTIRQSVEIMLPADTVRDVVYIDRLIDLTDTVIVDNPDTRARLTYYIDQYDNALTMLAECKPDTIRDTVVVDAPVVIPCPEPSKKERIQRDYERAAGFALPAIILIIILFIKLKKS